MSACVFLLLCGVRATLPALTTSRLAAALKDRPAFSGAFSRQQASVLALPLLRRQSPLLTLFV
jgi:predicted MFS family arabinose efflux permease